jgi:hypothetical protein
MDAPSATRRKASPKSLAPQTNGTSNFVLSMWNTSSRRREHFAFVNIVYLDGLQDLRFNKMTNPYLGHYRDCNGFLNAPDHFGIAHPRYAARSPDIRRDAFKRHDSARSRVLGNLACSGVVTSMITPPLSICAKFLLSSYLLFIIPFSLTGCCNMKLFALL